MLCCSTEWQPTRYSHSPFPVNSHLCQGPVCRLDFLDAGSVIYAEQLVIIHDTCGFGLGFGV